MRTYKNVTISMLATGCSCMCRHCYASATRSLSNPIDRDKASLILDMTQGLFDRSEENLVDIYYDLFDHNDAVGLIRLLRYEKVKNSEFPQFFAI